MYILTYHSFSRWTTLLGLNKAMEVSKMMNSYKMPAQSVAQGLLQPQRPFDFDCLSLRGLPVSLYIALDQSRLILPFAQLLDNVGKK